MAGAGTMTTEERVTFLADVHVGVLAVEEPGRGPCALPVWYLVDGDEVVIRLAEGSVKHRLLLAAGRATMTVQTETPPYQYVSVEGPVVIGTLTSDGLEMASRYLGPELGRWYVDQTAGQEIAEVEVRLRPERWRSHDFNKAL